jgi:hypothetical protein
MKKETLEEAAERFYGEEEIVNDYDISGYLQSAFLTGAKWQQEQYEILFDEYHEYTVDCIEVELKRPLPLQKWFEQFKKK